jgi:hypothetical protein
MRLLTKEEQDSFREDFRETEKEIQKYIGVYLSGLILVTGWIVGPQSKPVLEIARSIVTDRNRAVMVK